MSHRPRTTSASTACGFPEVEYSEPEAYYGEVGNAFDALCYAWLYWPALLEWHGSVFVLVEGGYRQHILDEFESASRKRPAGWSQREWKNWVDSFNWFEMSSLFRNWGNPLDRNSDALEALAQPLVETWSARLRAAFPEREFVVRLVDDDPHLELSIEITQTAPELLPPTISNPSV